MGAVEGRQRDILPALGTALARGWRQRGRLIGRRLTRVWLGWSADVKRLNVLFLVLQKTSRSVAAAPAWAEVARAEPRGLRGGMATRHTQASRRRHFGLQANAIERAAGQHAGHAVLIPQHSLSFSSAVHPAAGGVGGWTRSATADPSLSPHERRSAPRLERGRCRNRTDSPRVRSAQPGVATASHTDPASASLWPGRACAAGQGRGSLSGCTTESLASPVSLSRTGCMQASHLPAQPVRRVP